MAHLVPGSILSLFKKDSAPSTIVLQVHQSKSIPDGDRLRMMLNDGKFSINAIFKSNEAQQTIENFKKLCYLKIIQFEVTTATNGKTFLIIDRADVVGQGNKPLSADDFTNIDKYLSENPLENQLEKIDTSANNNNNSNIKNNGNSNNNNSNTSSYSKIERSTNPPSNTPKNLMSIDQLSPFQNNWTIKARVSFKGDLRTWSNQRGEGKLFNFNLLDETGEIRATAFNQAAEMFYDLIKENNVYYVSRAALVNSKPQFSTLSHPYELQLDKNTKIDPANDDSNVPKLSFNFVKLDQIQNLDNNTVIDILGVLKTVEDKHEIVAKSTGKPYDRRDIILVDDSQFAITVALWNKAARDFSMEPGTVLALKGCRIQDFSGKSLSLIPSSTIMSNPDLADAYKLKGWYDNQGINENFKNVKAEVGGSFNNDLNSKENIQNRKSIKLVQDEKLGFNEKPDYFNLKSTVSYIKPDNFYYPACSSEGCSKKVTEQPDGTWRCEKCNINHPEPDLRYILTCSVVDETGQLWLNLFNDQAVALLGISAKEMVELKEKTDNSLRLYLNKHCLFKEFSFRIRARVDSYNGIDRARFQVLSLASINFESESEFLVEQFDKFQL